MSLIPSVYLIISHLSPSLIDFPETSKKQRQRECKRPDMQRYQPGVGQRRKGSAEGEVQAASSECVHVDSDVKMPSASPSGSDLKLVSRNCQSGPSAITVDSANNMHSHAGTNVIKDGQGSSTDILGSPKLSRKTRKPDREIYQPGGRRSQGSRDSGSNKHGSKEEVKGEEGELSKENLIGSEKNKDVRAEPGKEKEEKGKGRKGKEGKKKREVGKQQKSLELSSDHNDPTPVENLTDKVEKLNISSPQAACMETEEKKGTKGDDGGNRRRKSNGDNQRNKAAGGEGIMGAEDEKRNQRSNRRSRGGRERGSNQASGKREEGEGGEKSSSTNQLEKNTERMVEGGHQWDVQKKDVYQDQNLQQQKHRGNQPREKDGERRRAFSSSPAHTELTASPEPGPRLMGGMRGGGMGLGRGRGVRGGSTRRLWDPNNPDKKPALASYGPLHFLDTDDETNFQSHQAAAMAYYKFQNSDNPYGYSLPTSATNTPPRYAFPYQFPYQIPGSNGMYPNAAMPFYGAYGQSGQGYPPVSGTAIATEEAEVQTRGELVKMLRLADSQELQLSNLLSRERLSPEGLDRMAQLRAELLTLYERVILTDIEFSDSQNLDQALWKNVFYQVIERFRQLLKDQDSDTAPQLRAMLLTILEEGAMFFDTLLQKLQTIFQFKLEDYMDGMAIRARPLRKTVKYALISAQRCMICQGDIARYREQASDSANYGKARSWYLKAQQIAPKNGRPYNQLALLAVYTKRKLDAVYYYMRSLAASNPILTAKESLMSLFEEAKRKAEQIERRRKQDSEGSVCGPRGRGWSRGEDATRQEIWIRPSGHPGVPSRTAGNESSKDSEQDGGLSSLNASDLNKRFILSFLHTHGKLFTKVGMESFPAVAGRVLQEFRALLQHSPSPLGSTRMLQIMTINMFTIHYAQTRETRSVLEEQTTSLGLAMFGLLVQRCTDLLKETPAEEESMVRVSAFSADLRELLPSVKVWSDWMLGHPEQWNPPPYSVDPDVWQCLAELCNALARVHHSEIPLYKADGDGEGDEELRLLVLEEDGMLAGFVPLLAAPQEPCYIDPQTDTAMASDCKRVTVLKYFLEALCGQEEPLLAFKGGKYISVAVPPVPSQQVEDKNESQVHEQNQEVEGDGSEDDIKELRARRHALTHELAQQQKRRDKIQAVLQTGGQLELEIRPFYLVPDTNGFIDHLEGLRKLLACGSYVLVVPLIVITELDGLAKGQESRDGDCVGVGGAAHAKMVQECAKAAVTFLEKGFEAREPGLRALTSRGNQLESIAFRSEDTSGQKGNNDDLILSCCLHYCQDKAKDFMPANREGPVRLRREVVLLTDDRNLRVKALTRNVPVRDIPAFLSWAKVG
uniref:Telomerase-binding protein EST1A n=1 Tax=Astyanax mexicanus TaxID=7994 RepID=W5LDM5_ASTMX